MVLPCVLDGVGPVWTGLNTAASIAESSVSLWGTIGVQGLLMNLHNPVTSTRYAEFDQVIDGAVGGTRASAVSAWLPPHEG